MFLSEMKKLREIAPNVYKALLKGAFVGRRFDGHHNGVSPDVLIEQTYKEDAKEESGLDGITLNVSLLKVCHCGSICATQVDVASELRQCTP